MLTMLVLYPFCLVCSPGCMAFIGNPLLELLRNEQYVIYCL